MFSKESGTLLDKIIEKVPSSMNSAWNFFVDFSIYWCYFIVLLCLLTQAHLNKHL